MLVCLMLLDLWISVVCRRKGLTVFTDHLGEAYLLLSSTYSCKLRKSQDPVREGRVLLLIFRILQDIDSHWHLIHLRQDCWRIVSSSLWTLGALVPRRWRRSRNRVRACLTDSQAHRRLLPRGTRRPVNLCSTVVKCVLFTETYRRRCHWLIVFKVFQIV